MLKIVQKCNKPQSISQSKRSPHDPVDHLIAFLYLLNLGYASLVGG